MTETILCAVHDSDAARQVLDTARGFRQAWGAGRVVVRVLGGDDGMLMRRAGAAAARSAP